MHRCRQSNRLGAGAFDGRCAVALARVIEEADLPKGAFNLVIGDGPVVGDEIVAHPLTRGVGFTGSPATGQRIAERAAGKPQLLELGGNGPFIVLADANLDAAAEGIAFSAYRNAGRHARRPNAFLSTCASRTNSSRKFWR